MPLPRPERGLVIHFDYLWRHEHDAGQEDGSKGRPCLIVAVTENGNGRLEAVVAPVTHLAPAPPAAGVEIPPRVKHHLGLDDERSWVITTDLNVFLWPGVDIRPVPNAAEGTFHYGFLPPRLFAQIRKRIVAAAAVVTRQRMSEPAAQRRLCLTVFRHCSVAVFLDHAGSRGCKSTCCRPPALTPRA